MNILHHSAICCWGTAPHAPNVKTGKKAYVNNCVFYITSLCISIKGASNANCKFGNLNCTEFVLNQYEPNMNAYNR